MYIDNTPKLDFKDVLICHKYSKLTSNSDIKLERIFKMKHSIYEFHGIPIIASNIFGTFNTAIKLAKFKMITCISKRYSLDDWKLFIKNINDNNLNYIAITIGIEDTDFIFLTQIIQLINLKIICIEVHNGYTENFIKFVSKIRQTYPTKIIIAGNVVTSDMAHTLILSGADIVTIGNGFYSKDISYTTGIGYPQLSSIIECAKSAHNVNGYIISNPYINTPGDISKALGGGADFIMLDNTFSESIESILEYLHSTCIYIGASCIEDLPKNTKFIRIL